MTFTRKTANYANVLLSYSLLIEEIKGFALVTGQLLQGAALLLDGRLNLSSGCVVLDIHGCFHRCRLLGCPPRRAEQTAETGGVRAGKWRGRGRGRWHTDKTYRGVVTSSGSSSKGRVLTFKGNFNHTSAPCWLSHRWLAGIHMHVHFHRKKKAKTAKQKSRCAPTGPNCLGNTVSAAWDVSQQHWTQSGQSHFNSSSS